jgi:prephenate dehydrogenase
LGLGLMGGSLAMRLKGQCARLIGFDSHHPTLELALSKRIIDHADALSPSLLGRGVRGEGESRMKVDVLILAIPVPSILNLIQQLPSLISSPCIVMDIGSTKRDILQAMDSLPENFDPIGGHPICGKEKLGLEHAEAGLFQNTPFVTTPLKRTTLRAREALKQIILTIGANPIEMDAWEHDRALASTSHLPFLLSSALALSTPPEFVPFVGTGFKSTSRLAGTPSHMTMGILQSNRENILHAMQTFRNSLDQLETALQSEDYKQLELLLNQSRSAYQSLVSNY